MLGADTGRRHRGRAFGDLGVQCDLRQSEIQHLGVPALGDKDVGGLDVAMDDSFRVRCVQRIGNLNSQGQQDFQLERSPGNAVLQRQAVKEFHDDEGLAVLLINFVDGADIRVVQGRRRLGLALKTPQGLGITGNIFRQKLQGHETAQLQVFGLVDNAHAAAAELFNNAVMRDGLADHGTVSRALQVYVLAGVESIWRPGSGPGLHPIQ